MGENQEEKKDEIVEIEENTEGTNDGIKISNDVVAVIAGVAVSEVQIDVNIIVEYGSRIPDVAFEIQNRVKKSVENMTGLKVSEVNVHVQGVRTEKEENNNEESEEQKGE